MQVFADEITLPTTKPETEWIAGRAVFKVRPTREHAIMQGAFLMALYAWGHLRGQVGSEWRFRVAVPGVAVHPLVPDVAFMSFERLRLLPKDERAYPLTAPEIVIEILSPDDRDPDVEAKRKEYFAWGVTLEIIVDYRTRTIDVYDSKGGFERIDGSVETYSPAILPDLALPLRAMFAGLEIPGDEISRLKVSVHRILRRSLSSCSSAFPCGYS